MRDTFAQELYKIAIKDSKIRLVAADISPAGKLINFSKKYPERFLNVGVAEASMISICAGMAMMGLKPFAYSIASFSLFRPFENIRVDVGYQNLPVTIVGMGAGTIYSTLGGTHITPDDIGIVRCLPNFIIISPCDPVELKESLKFLSRRKKNPAYLRIGKSGEKIFVNKYSKKWEFGKPRQLIKGKTICLIASGPIIRLYYEILNNLNSENIYPSIYSFHTLKPVNKIFLRNFFSTYNLIVTLEDASEVNGLEAIIKENAFLNNYKGKIIGFSLKDKHIKNYGSQNDLLSSHGITPKNIYKEILRKI